MDAQTVKSIVDRWMIPTPGGAYMAGLEKRPVIASAQGVYVFDTTGKRSGSGCLNNFPRLISGLRADCERC